MNEVVLVGHSYGGFIVGAVADRIPGRIAALVYLDAFIPVNDMAMLDTVEPSDIPAIVRSTGEHGGYLVPSFSAAAFGVNEADVALVNSLVTPQPFGTLTERITLSGAYMGIRKKVYVHAPRHRPSPLGLLNLPEIIGLADYNAIFAQQCVDHADMEEEIRQHEVGQIREAGEFPHTDGK